MAANKYKLSGIYHLGHFNGDAYIHIDDRNNFVLNERTEKWVAFTVTLYNVYVDVTLKNNTFDLKVFACGTVFASNNMRFI